jgi:NTP pyrophosphatase (non-canonical NTP hydrolase)
MITYPDKLVKASLKTKRDIIARALKLSEETGELAAEALKIRGLKGKGGKNDVEVLHDLREEAVDVFIMSLDILLFTKTSEEELNRLIDKKLNKWLKQIKK